MKIKLGINGLGRIGRMVIRSIIENNIKDIEIKHINNKTNSEGSFTLLKYDSVHGKFNADLGFDEKHLIINKNKITFSQETVLNNINWKKYGVDYVFECTGKFNTKDKLQPHLNNGAKKVIVSAPCKNADKTIVFGVNESELKENDKKLLNQLKDKFGKDLGPVVKKVFNGLNVSLFHITKSISSSFLILIQLTPIEFNVGITASPIANCHGFPSPNSPLIVIIVKKGN